KVVAPDGAIFSSARHRKGHSHTDHEHKGGLDYIPEDRPFPRHMVERARYPAPCRIVLQSCETKSVRSEKQHDEPAICVKRNIPPQATGLLLVQTFRDRRLCC